MVIRTPRRRVSPRTKLKYRAVKNFFRKALGTSSEGNTCTKSSLEVSVLDLKSKLEGIEQELNKVSKHCQDLSCLETNLGRESENIELRDSKPTTSRKHSRTERNHENVETKLLYKNSYRQFQKNNESNDTITTSHDHKNNMTLRNFNENVTKFQLNPKNSVNKKFNEMSKNKFNERLRRTKSKLDDLAVPYSTSSFHSLFEHKYDQRVKTGISGHHQEKSQRKEQIRSISPKSNRKRQTLDNRLPENYVISERKRNKHERNKREYPGVDQEFIDKIIKKQYKPVKIFGTRESDFSQFSAPVCRDQEFLIPESIQEGSELCSCRVNENKRHRHQYVCYNDRSDMRSVCDTRLYSSKRHRRRTIPREYVDDYNNSNFYDIIPVKEKSSPKSRRKFAEENFIDYQYLREVPPSPKSHRPRLNLKAQHRTEYDEYSRLQSRKPSPLRNKHRESYETNNIYECFPQKQEHATSTTFPPQNITQFPENNDTMSNLRSPTFVNGETNIINNDTTLDTQDMSLDKTDKALSEIKDLLQNFLLEMKKESIHSDKSNITSKIGEKSFNNTIESDKVNTAAIPNSGHNFNMGQCNVSPFLPTFTNPCCYPIYPIYPMNCLQNGYILPRPSFTCNTCAKNSLTNACGDQQQAKCEKENHETNEKVSTTSETKELIKEIHKFISQNQKSPTKLENHNRSDTEYLRNVHRKSNRIILTNRSVGSSKASKHDANIGTLNLRSFSKSCEALGSRINSETYNTTNASYSDTVLEKLSLESSESSTESSISSHVPEKKKRRSKFGKLIKSMRLFKKKRNDTIEEVTESESTIEIEVKQKAKPKPPFKQNVAAYAMHGQEYYCPPPKAGHCYQHPNHYHPNYDYSHQPLPDTYQRHAPMHGIPYDPRMSPNFNPMTHPTCPNYDPHVPPQVPLCLKEVEVKSTATQSERKMSLFRKFAKPQLNQDASKQQAPLPASKPKPSFWETLQEKAKLQNPDPMDFSLKTQKQLAQGDMKMRNAMLKKLFYKRNPFSPRNLIIRTLLGKDRSSYGDPPKMYKPRMFI